jgi:fermentation-respiration switch protein FrsA (DUF1100 family)
VAVIRQKVRFVSGGTECIAWHYPGTNGACVVMAGGFAVPKEPATDMFAARFHEVGYAVLAFDYRGLGESGGEPCLVLPIKHQLADWQAAIDFARTLPDVDPARVAIWGFSTSGGHLFPVAVRNPELAAVIAQTPTASGLASTRNALRYQKARAMLRFTGRSLVDALGSLVGRQPRLVPLVGRPGSVAMLTTPDAQDGALALDAGSHPDWQQAVAARSALRLTFYRPGRYAVRVRSPLLVVVCDDDATTPAQLTIAAVRGAPRAEVVRLPGGHYEPFLGGHERAVDAELSFLREHVLDRVAALDL